MPDYLCKLYFCFKSRCGFVTNWHTFFGRYSAIIKNSRYHRVVTRLVFSVQSFENVTLSQRISIPTLFSNTYIYIYSAIFVVNVSHSNFQVFPLSWDDFFLRRNYLFILHHMSSEYVIKCACVTYVGDRGGVYYYVKWFIAFFVYEYDFFFGSIFFVAIP